MWGYRGIRWCLRTDCTANLPQNFSIPYKNIHHMVQTDILYHTMNLKKPPGLATVVPLSEGFLRKIVRFGWGGGLIFGGWLIMGILRCLLRNKNIKGL